MYLRESYHIRVYIACLCLLTTIIRSDTCTPEDFDNFENLLDSRTRGTFGNEFETTSDKSVRVQLTYGSFIGARFPGYDRFTGIPYVCSSHFHFSRHTPQSFGMRKLRMTHDADVHTNFGLCQAEPPVGDLRLRNPIPPRGYYHNLNVQVRTLDEL